MFPTVSCLLLANYLLVPAYISFAAARRAAIMLNSSHNYYNYRHFTDILLFHNILTKNGFADRDIVVMTGQDPIKDPRHKIKGEAWISEDEKLEYKEFKCHHLTAQLVLNNLDLKNKLYDLDERDNLLVVYCGHGGWELMRSGYVVQWTFPGDFMRIIHDLSLRVGKVLFILDTCQAETHINRRKIPSNAFVVTTSGKMEYCYSNGNLLKLGVYPIDTFAHRFYRMVKTPEMKLTDVFSALAKDGLRSVVTFSGNTSFTLGDFIYQDSSPRKKVLPFVLKQHYL